MKVAAYLRVSTTDQGGEDRYGLPAQEQDIVAFTKAEGMTISAWFCDDGISGGTLDRPQLQELLRRAKNGEFNAVIVAKYDRVARDLFAALFIEKELLVAGVEIYSASEPISGRDPMNTAFRQMMGVFAELEKSMINARMTGGRNQKARGGGYSGGCPPIGYRARRGSKVLEIDHSKAEAVKRIFELDKYQPRLTLQQIADQLNKEGYTTVRGKSFGHSQVKRILDNEEFYRGIYRYGDICTAGTHPPILTNTNTGGSHASYNATTNPPARDV